MNCKDFKELLSAYADGELSLTQKDFIEEHLAACPDCVATVNSYKGVNLKISSLRGTPAMQDIKGATMSKIKRKQTIKPTRKWLQPALIVIAIIGIVAALFTIDTSGTGTGGYVMSPPPPTGEKFNLIFSLFLLSGFLAMQDRIIKNSAYIKKAAGYTSIILGITGIGISICLSTIGNISFLLITCPLYLYGIILGIITIRKQKVNKWAINAGIILCILNSILSAIIFMDYSIVLVIAAVVTPLVIILFAYRKSIYTSIKSLVFYRGNTWSPRKLIRTAAMIAGTAIVLLAATSSIWFITQKGKVFITNTVNVDMLIYSSIEELFASSNLDAVVIGTVKGVAGHDTNKGIPLVFYTFEVSDVLFGNVDETIIVSLIDTNSRTKTSLNDNVTQFIEGEQLLLFLGERDSSGLSCGSPFYHFYTPISYDNGVFDILPDGLVSPRMQWAFIAETFTINEIREIVSSDFVTAVMVRQAHHERLFFNLTMND